MIEDLEFRSLFKTESQEHLQQLDDKLLGLEKDPKDQASLQEAFRIAHSLKGSARMLGVTGVEAIAHRFEDMLDSARLGTTILSSEVVDRMYGALDAIRELVHEALTGEPVASTSRPFCNSWMEKVLERPRAKHCNSLRWPDSHRRPTKARYYLTRSNSKSWSQRYEPRLCQWLTDRLPQPTPQRNTERLSAKRTERALASRMIALPLTRSA